MLFRARRGREHRMLLVPVYESLPLVARDSARVTTPDGDRALELSPPSDPFEVVYFWSQHALVDASMTPAANPHLPATADTPSIGWTDFAIARQLPRLGRFDGSPEELLDLIRLHWNDRRPGTGRVDLAEVVRVPMPPERFRTSTATLSERSVLKASVQRRRSHEDPYIRVTTTDAPDPARFAEVVLYRNTLLVGDVEPHFDSEWGVTAVLASAVDDEPMHPVTMARNFLRKPGGSFAPYTHEELTRAVDYWSRHAHCS
ncbi:MAG: DUF3228 family protein [Clostridia bacterium]|nr:DUF3228 family protein [Deltaproteobacteria bacterium]